MGSHAKNPVIQQLRRQLRRMEQVGPRAAQASAPASIGIRALDALLVPEALRSGMIIEWVIEGAGSGAVRLVLSASIEALHNGGALVVIDDRREFYPPAAVRLGLDLDRTVVVR